MGEGKASSIETRIKRLEERLGALDNVIVELRDDSSFLMAALMEGYLCDEVTCDMCHGSCLEPDMLGVCARCGGEGTILVPKRRIKK